MFYDNFNIAPNFAQYSPERGDNLPSDEVRTVSLTRTRHRTNDGREDKSRREGVLVGVAEKEMIGI